MVIGAIDGLAIAALVIGLMVLLIVYAVTYLGQLLGQVLGQIPLIGGWIQSHFDSSVEDMRRWADSAWGYLTHGIAYFSNAARNNVKTMIAQAIHLGGEAYTTAYWLVHTEIPHIASGVVGSAVAGVRSEIGVVSGVVSAHWDRLVVDLAHVAARFDAVISDYKNRIGRAAADAAAATAAVDSRLTADLGNIAHQFDHVYDTITAGVAAAEADAARVAKSLFGTAEADAARALATVEAGIESDISAVAHSIAGVAAGVIATDIEHGVEAITGDLTDAVAGAITAAEGGFADVTDWVKQIPFTQALDLAGVTAMSIATAGALTRYLEQCGEPNCRNLSKFGRDLKDLESLLGSADLLQFLIDLIRNPSGFARSLFDEFQPLISEGESFITSLVA